MSPDPRHRAGSSRRIPTVGGLLAACVAAGVALAGPLDLLSASTERPVDIRVPITSPSTSAGPSTVAYPPGRASGPRTIQQEPPLPPAPSPVRVPVEGSGRFSVASVRPEQPDAGGAVTYTVEVEVDLPFLPGRTAELIGRVLDDERGWSARGAAPFVQVPGKGDLRIVVASPATTDLLCAPLETLGRVSCRNGALVVINARRWAFGVTDYRGHLADYRRYVVNHEVGHALGEAHVECPGAGEPAPVMLQQTYGLDGCARNPWPAVA